MKVFFRENIVLIAGVALPFLLTLVFFAATQIDKVSTNPPRYRVIFATNYYGHNADYPYKLIVKNHRLHFLYSPPKKESVARNWQIPRLFVYDPVRDISREIEIPAIDNEDEKKDAILPELSASKVTVRQESPDGYVFEYEYRGHGNLMTGIFGSGFRSRAHFVLRKGSHTVNVPKSIRYNSQFIGWILDEQESSDE